MVVLHIVRSLSLCKCKYIRCGTDNHQGEKIAKRHRLDNSCISADIMSPLCSSCIMDTRRLPAAFVGKTVTVSGKAVNALCPPAAQSPSQDRRHESILIPAEKHLKYCHPNTQNHTKKTQYFPQFFIPTCSRQSEIRV